MLLILMIVLLLAALAGGGWSYPRYGWTGMSPAGVVLVLLAILFFTGNLHAR
jgi:hypothetical protein